jgi:anti-anti-sigma factor
MDINIFSQNNECGTIQMIGQFWDPDEIRGFRGRVEELLDKGIRQIVVDLSRVSFISSQGIGTMVHLFSLLKTKDVTVVLFKPVGCVKELMEISGLDTVMKIAHTDEELASFLQS